LARFSAILKNSDTNFAHPKERTMKAKYFIAAAAILIGSCASAQSIGTHARSSASAHVAAASRHAVLDNIMGRVQVDALISDIVETDAVAPARLASDAVASGDTKQTHRRRDVAFAATTTARTRS